MKDDTEDLDCTNLTLEEARALSNGIVLRSDELTPQRRAILAAMDETNEPTPQPALH